MARPAETYRGARRNAARAEARAFKTTLRRLWPAWRLGPKADWQKHAFFRGRA